MAIDICDDLIVLILVGYSFDFFLIIGHLLDYFNSFVLVCFDLYIKFLFQDTRNALLPLLGKWFMQKNTKGLLSRNGVKVIDIRQYFMQMTVDYEQFRQIHQTNTSLGRNSAPINYFNVNNAFVPIMKLSLLIILTLKK